MKDEINYKELWFQICEEKKQLQLENHRLKTNYDYVCKEFSSLERIHNALIQRNWNTNATSSQSNK